MIKTFKRLAAVVSLSLIISIVAVPCAVFFMSTQTVSAAEVTGTTETGETAGSVTKAYRNDKALSKKQDDTTAQRAQNFDAAKKEATEVASEVEVKPAAALTQSTEYLLDIANPDYSYEGRAISITGYDRDVLERLVMGEAGAEGYIGCCLVAQAIRDTMVNDGYKTVEAVRTNCGYQATLSRTPNSDAKRAVEFIFDQGGAAVQHDVIYFYAPALCTSGFHESQEFVVQYNNQRFFDRW
ncbi:MAG: hypothetical protein IJC86_03030 [Clostridia bacterium]|nr:hypothetical protein [Clostridia bacterium]